VDDVRPLAQHQPVELPDRDRVLGRDLAAHLWDDVRADAERLGEVAHVVLARRHHARDQQRLDAADAQARLQPGHVPRRPPDVQPRDDAKNFHQKK
jgi:hypothetical protein